MRPRFRATLLAALVTAVAIGLPCSAWYSAGARAARDQAERLRTEPELVAGREAAVIVRQVSARLAALRQSENRRSFLDYDPREDLLLDETCEIRVESPLAAGPTDPLVWAHFQIDAVGQLTLPTLRGSTADGRRQARELLGRQQTIFELLECTTPTGLATPPADNDARRPQHVRGPEGEWIAGVGDFRWHTLELENRPALVALRAVSTPSATLTQGFVVRQTDLVELVRGASPNADIRPGSPGSPIEAALLLDDDTWTIAIDAQAQLLAAHEQAGHVSAAFIRQFLLGLAAALLAGGLVVGLVWQSERLAVQRAGFAAAAAHELRTPLAGLRLYGEMLAHDDGDPANRRLYAERVSGEAARLGRVVSNLLGFSRLERGLLQVRAVEGDLGACVGRITEQLGPLLDALGLRLEVRVADALPTVRFDADAVEQILQNLLDNAEKYTRDAADRSVTLSVEAVGNDAVELSVADRGPGVDPALRRRLFRPFVRSRDTDAPAGLGLGLALVDALVQAQGAEMSYADRPGGGARFVCRFVR